MEVEMAAVPRFRQQGSGLEGHRTNLRSKWCESHPQRSEEHTSELQSPCHLVCRLLLEKKKHKDIYSHPPTRHLLLAMSNHLLPLCYFLRLWPQDASNLHNAAVAFACLPQLMQLVRPIP